MAGIPTPRFDADAFLASIGAPANPYGEPVVGTFTGGTPSRSGLGGKALLIFGAVGIAAAIYLGKTR